MQAKTHLKIGSTRSARLLALEGIDVVNARVHACTHALDS